MSWDDLDIYDDNDEFDCCDYDDDYFNVDYWDTLAADQEDNAMYKYFGRLIYD
jgi:hypothetical protein